MSGERDRLLSWNINYIEEPHPLGKLYAFSNEEFEVSEAVKRVRLVFRQTRGALAELPIGLLLRPQQGGEYFLARKAGLKETEFEQEVNKILAEVENLRVINGEVQIIREGVSKRIVEIGLQEDERKALNSEEATFRVSMMGRPRGSTNKAKRDEVSENDSFGKEQWRGKMMEKFKKMIPAGFRNDDSDFILPDERGVACFPGAGGKEVEMWLKLGFKEEHFLMIERDQRLAVRLRNKYPNAILTTAEIGPHGSKKSQTFRLGRSFEAVRERLKRVTMLEKSRNKGRFGVLSFDPQGALTESFFEDMKFFVDNIGMKCFFSANFNLKRESQQQIELYERIARKSLADFDNDLHQLRLAAMYNLPIALTLNKGSGPRESIPGFITTGHYEGDSELTRMYWVMAWMSNF